jgi:ribonuclease BN (tRNA processing enzyme)
MLAAMLAAMQVMRMRISCRSFANVLLAHLHYQHEHLPLMSCILFRLSGANTVSVTLHIVTSMCSVMLQRFESRQVANVLWAIANLRDRQEELTRRLDARILQVQI